MGQVTRAPPLDRAGPPRRFPDSASLISAQLPEQFFFFFSQFVTLAALGGRKAIFLICFLERGERKEKERERNIDA